MEIIPMKDRMFQRLANIVKERFDTVITFTDFSARLRVADARISSTVQRNSMSDFIAVGDDVVLPVRGSSDLFGYITVFNGIKLPPTAIQQIREVTDLLLTETCILEDKQQRSMVLEHYLRSQSSYDQVVSLFDRMEKEDIRYINPEISINAPHADQVYPILVESHTIQDAKEFAFEMHRISNCSSFVTYESYLAPELSSVENIKMMGPVTLFVENIKKLNSEMQDRLDEYLRSPTRTNLHPRIIVAVQESPDDLIAEGRMSRSLFEKLCSARVKLPPKTASTMTTDEILNFFKEITPQQPERHLQIVRPLETAH